MKKILVILGTIIILTIVAYLLTSNQVDDQVLEDDNIDVIENYFNTGGYACNDIFRGIFIPYLDEKIVIDDQYIDAATVGIVEYDMTRVPDEVKDYMALGYLCDAYVPSYSDGSTIEWGCYLDYADYQFLNSDDNDGKEGLEEQGYECTEQECFNGPTADFLWTCVKS